ncbi:Innexin inx3 [Cichlidogyrus casuarinus]|uniref:Innexin n=1 Tax=Cichlidogyrus casuarinus TaxID=1844966 RepID=A0ABD2PSH2_9PLAT
MILNSCCCCISYSLCLCFCGSKATPSIYYSSAPQVSKRSKQLKFRKGTFLVYLYFTIKLLYFLNIILQLILLEKFFGANFNFMGVRILSDLVQGKSWPETGHFPRVTFCDFEAKKIGANDRYTLQCVLPLNMFLEKTCILLWFWFAFLGIMTLISAWNWFRRLSQYSFRMHFVRQYLLISASAKGHETGLIRAFVEKHLMMDGVFLLRLVALNAGELVAGNLITCLWTLYKNNLIDMDGWPGDQDRQCTEGKQRQGGRITDENSGQMPLSSSSESIV